MPTDAINMTIEVIDVDEQPVILKSGLVISGEMLRTPTKENRHVVDALGDLHSCWPAVDASGSAPGRLGWRPTPASFMLTWHLATAVMLTFRSAP